MNRNTRSLRSLATRQSRRRNNQFTLFTRKSPPINPVQPPTPDQVGLSFGTRESPSDLSLFGIFAPTQDAQAEQADANES